MPCSETTESSDWLGLCCQFVIRTKNPVSPARNSSQNRMTPMAPAWRVGLAFNGVDQVSTAGGTRGGLQGEFIGEFIAHIEGIDGVE